VDFAPTEAQQDLAALTRRILADRATPERQRVLEDSGSRFDPELWSALAEAGVLAAALPEHVGGSGFGLLEQCSVLIEIGRAVAPVPYLASVVLGAAAIARFGDAEQQERWARPAATGDLVLTAALDAETPVRAVEHPSGRWALTGTLTTVPSGPVADLVLVPADTGLFLVTPDDPGVTMRPQEMVDGDTAGRLELADVELGADRVLGGEAVVDWLTAHATVGVCATQLGVVERAVELTAEYARTRVQFDRPIGSFQAVSQRLADAHVDVEAIRLTLWQAAWQLSAGLPAEAAVATAKFWAADGGHRIAHTAVHLHGGVGIDLDHVVHRYFVAAKRNEFALGGATPQLRKLGALLAES
jgi:alkylation response protein AidB-like acyl-CoA dehydrogenase